MVNNFKLITLLLLAFFIPITLSNDLPDHVPSLLKYNPEHSHLLRLVAAISEQGHFSKKKISNESSHLILKNYLNTLDSQKIYFTQSDINYFQRYRYKIDDALKNGNLEPIFDIFRIYRLRVQQRIEYSIKIINSTNSFLVDDEYDFSRENVKWQKDVSILDTSWEKKSKNDLLSILLAGQEINTAKKTLNKRYQKFLNRINNYESNDVIDIFLNSYVHFLDPHSNYLNPNRAEEYEIQTTLSYQGIGARLELSDDYVQIQSIIPGSPAFKNGELKPLDKIIGVLDNESDELIDVIGWELDEVVKLIRGPKNTDVTLQILPTGSNPDGNPYLLTLERDEVELEQQAASSYIETINNAQGTYSIGIIKVPSFYQDFAARRRGDKDYRSTTLDVMKIVENLVDIGIDALTIDLRGNSGGLLDEAASLTGLFINDGPLVQLKDTNEKIDVIEDPIPGSIYDGPMVVLIDRFSASASEIFAGAIQDYKRGIIIGQKTYGKGSVQSLYPLDRYSRFTSKKGFGQLTLTIAKYYRVTGAGTQNKGVIPDIVLPSFIDERLIGEETKINSLPWDKIPSLEFNTNNSLKEPIHFIENNFKSRSENNLPFDYLKEDIKRSFEQRENSIVSLNIETRTASREQILKDNKGRRSSRLKALGFEEESFDDFRNQTILNEIYNMVVDYINYLNPPVLNDEENLFVEVSNQ
ncbi:MAG: carboxy terminal-processing peptidase [Gammaproteobacteria bacterium]|nr:carboxy terminal-processing peptidase [Gammaproteobacteria bacterium]